MGRSWDGVGIFNSGQQQKAKGDGVGSRCIPEKAEAWDFHLDLEGSQDKSIFGFTGRDKASLLSY